MQPGSQPIRIRISKLKMGLQAPTLWAVKKHVVGSLLETISRNFIYKILRSRARSEKNHLSFLSLMTLSIVTLFNKKAEPAELDFWGFGVRKNVAGSEFGNSGSAN